MQERLRCSIAYVLPYLLCVLSLLLALPSLLCDQLQGITSLRVPPGVKVVLFDGAFEGEGWPVCDH